LFLGLFAKLLMATVSLVVSICPHATTRLPLKDIFLILVFRYFSENL